MEYAQSNFKHNFNEGEKMTPLICKSLLKQIMALKFRLRRYRQLMKERLINEQNFSPLLRYAIFFKH